MVRDGPRPEPQVVSASALVGGVGFGWSATGCRVFLLSIFPDLTLRLGGIVVVEVGGRFDPESGWVGGSWGNYLIGCVQLTLQPRLKFSSNGALIGCVPGGVGQLVRYRGLSCGRVGAGKKRTKSFRRGGKGCDSCSPEI